MTRGLNGGSGKFTLAATGDILLHKRLYRTAKTDFGFDFNPKFENTKHLFDLGDLTVANQESIIGGKEIGLSSFPDFNSPIEIGQTLKGLGVDIVSLANNHAFDKEEEGVLASLANWNKIGMPYVGAYKSKEDAETLRVLEKNGLRVCFLSYTRGTNGKKIPSNKKYLVDKFHPDRMKSIKDKIKNIRNKNLADVIVVSMHYGKEYHLEPSADQKEVSADLSDAGADIIIGNHPHVLQPPAWIMNSRGKRSLAAYSLGNFYTGQEGLYRQIGGFFTVDIEKKSADSTMLTIDNPALKLTFVDSTQDKDFKMHLLEDIVNTREFIKTDMGEFNSKEVYEEIKARMTKWMPELTIS